MPTFRHEGHRLAYTIHGDDAQAGRTLVLVHGLLLSQKMHGPLARALAERGNRVITLDLLGHGRSDRPLDMTLYSMSFFGEQMIALLDHLELDEAVLGGTSLGANAALEAAVHAPERVRGMVIEMPVLDNALLASAVAFTPLMVALTFGEPVMKVLQAGARALPSRGLPFWGDVMLDWVRQDPAPSAAVIQGLFFGRTAPPQSERETFQTPALVIGHPRDPVHPFSDADALARELPNGRLIDASSFFEMRLAPERLTDEFATFIDECWKPRRAAPKRKRAAAK
jgi:pimeloyl-ACP methyl ester carboxylesterase